MRYLPEEPFITVVGKPFRIQGVKGTAEDKEEASNSDMLHWLLSMYTPQHGGHLVVGDIRKLNRVIETLEGEPEDGLYWIEDADFEVAEKVAVSMALALTPRNAPLIEDLLSACKKERPKENLALVKES